MGLSLLNTLKDTITESLNPYGLNKNATGVPSTILSALKKEYPNNWGRINDGDCETLEGVIDVHPAIEGERWSILNFFDTNPGVIRLLVDKYKEDNESDSVEDFKQWIMDSSNELFGNDSEFLQKLIKRNLQSFERGWQTESEAIEILKRDNPSLTDEDIVQFCLGSIKDRKESVDFKINGKGFQTKPASSMKRLKNGAIEVTTYGMKDWYKRKKSIDYILYCNGKNIAVFPNEKYWVGDHKNGEQKVVHYTGFVKDYVTI